MRQKTFIVIPVYHEETVIQDVIQEIKSSGFKNIIIVDDGSTNDTLLIIWSGILILSLFPEITHLVNRLLGMGDNLNTLIFIGFIIVFAAIYKLLTVIERTEQSVTELVRQEALKELKTKKRTKFNNKNLSPAFWNNRYRK